MATATSLQSRARQVQELEPWFHNLHLPDGTQTALDHPLGDFPGNLWRRFAAEVPRNLEGWRALDVGCNAGFYALELTRRGAQVTALDCDAHYLRQARWAAHQFGLEQRIEFRQGQVYDLAGEDTMYDLVWFMGVFYHLRYPLLALDILARKTARLMVFQTMTMPGDAVIDPPDDLPLDRRDHMLREGWPKMAFIEKRVANDPTNWWAPDHACVEAMLRSCGLCIKSHPTPEVYLCVPDSADPQGMKALNDAQYQAAIGTTRLRQPDVT